MKLSFLTFGLIVFSHIYSQSSTLRIIPRTNFIYEGVDNQIVIEGFNSLEKPIVTVLGGIIRKTSGQDFILRPNETDSCKIIIKGLPNYQLVLTLRINHIPEPDPSLNGVMKSGNVTAKEFIKMDKLELAISEFLENPSFQVNSFKVTYISAQAQTSSINYGTFYNSSIKNIIMRAKKGDIYIFDSINYEWANKVRLLNKSIVIRII